LFSLATSTLSSAIRFRISCLHGQQWRRGFGTRSAAARISTGAVRSPRNRHRRGDAPLSWNQATEHRLAHHGPMKLTLNKSGTTRVGAETNEGERILGHLPDLPLRTANFLSKSISSHVPVPAPRLRDEYVIPWTRVRQSLVVGSTMVCSSFMSTCVGGTNCCGPTPTRTNGSSLYARRNRRHKPGCLRELYFIAA
jgi:hypothetical protein